MTALVLASGSRYRRELLERLGLPFTAVAPDVDETPLPSEWPAALAARLARQKAMALADSARVVIGSDQVASLDGQCLGKPGTPEAALAQLVRCQGKTVHFHTAVCVLDHDTERRLEFTDNTEVVFASLQRQQLAHYVQREPAWDCAGGFKAEGLGISLFEAIRTDDPTALIGLPLIRLAGILRQCGFDPLGYGA